MQYVDTLLGRLLDALRANGLYDDAVIVVAADHGASFVTGKPRRPATRDNVGAIAPVPLFVKLPPFRTDVEREVVLALAAIAQEEGADALTVSNTVPVHEPRVSVGTGGLSGHALLEGTLTNVRQVRRATGGAIPINASGGISTAEEALAAVEAGATTVQVYTGLVFRGPAIVGELTRGLGNALRSRRIDLAELVGTG